MAVAQPRTIRTDSGALELIPATVDQLRGVARYWPMELVGAIDETGSFGLVFQKGDQEVFGIKLQPPDTSEQDAKLLHHMNRALIAAALPHYLEKQHRGVMVPCAYYKEKSAGVVETGLAFFVGPDPASASASPKVDAPYDEQLGTGATQMWVDMVAAIGKAIAECHHPKLTIIGVDLMPRLAIGGLAIHFLVEGPRVFVVKDVLHEDEPVWDYVVRAGFSKLPYAPMKPVGLPSQLPGDARHV